MRTGNGRKHNPRNLSSSDSLGTRLLERSDNVLWTIAPPGILLHNFAQGRFLELDELGYKAWGYLDGARTVDEVIAQSLAAAGAASTSSAAAVKKVRTIVQTLFANGFVEERKHE